MAEKTAAKQAEVMAKKYVQEYAQQQTLANDEQRARDKYDDYDYVLETYAIPLIKNDPALAYKIQSSKNPAMTAYKLGKLSDDYEESMTCLLYTSHKLLTIDLQLLLRMQKHCMSFPTWKKVA